MLQVVSKVYHAKAQSLATGASELIALVATHSHPNVVRLLGLVDRGYAAIKAGALELVLEFAERGNLETLLLGKPAPSTRKQLLDESKCLLTIAQDAAAGLSHMHSRRLVHRDIAPRNVFLTASGRAVIGDLGLTRFVDEKGRYPFDGKLPGSYYAPVLPDECEKDGFVTQKTDVWMLGCTLADLLHGEELGDGLGDWLTRFSVKPETGEGLSVDRKLAEAVVACLERDASKRPSAAELCMLLGVKPVSTVALDHKNHVVKFLGPPEASAPSLPAASESRSSWCTIL